LNKSKKIKKNDFDIKYNIFIEVIFPKRHLSGYSILDFIIMWEVSGEPKKVKYSIQLWLIKKQAV